MMRILLIIALPLLFACSQKTIGIAEMQDHYDQVKECMGGIGSVPAPNLNIVEGDSVMCGQFERRGCYDGDTMTITLPAESDVTTIRHEYVHHLLNVTTGDLDKSHTSPYFLKCSGIIIDDDVQ